MNSEKVPVITEEPYEGWLRYEIEGQKPWFKSPVPRTIIRSSGQLSEYLEREHAKNNLKEVTCDGFSFKRRMGLRVKSVSSTEDDHVSSSSREVLADDTQLGCCLSNNSTSSILNNLKRNGEVINHRRLLVNCASDIDTFRRNGRIQVNCGLLDNVSF